MEATTLLVEYKMGEMQHFIMADSLATSCKMVDINFIKLLKMEFSIQRKKLWRQLTLQKIKRMMQSCLPRTQQSLAKKTPNILSTKVLIILIMLISTQKTKPMMAMISVKITPRNLLTAPSILATR